MSHDELQSGQTIAEKYLIEHKLGKGGMGSVWSAQQLNLKSEVAIKVIASQFKDDADTLARFMQEANASALLRSPHVVQVYDVGQEDDFSYIVMERLEGESLRERLTRKQNLSPRETATILTHVGRAIRKAHDNGIVHRDLKPSNIFLVRNDDEFIAKVLDFGIAKSLDMALDAGDTPNTHTGSVMGTPYYMSPEQAAGKRIDDHFCDLWALGVIAFECLCGRLPFMDETIGGLVLQICTQPLPVPSSVGTVPDGFDAWFAHAMNHEKSERFSTVEELVSSLRELLLPGETTQKTDCPEPTSIQRYMDQQLPRGQREKVDAHLDSCPDCHELVVQLARSAADDGPPAESTRAAQADAIAKKASPQELEEIAAASTVIEKAGRQGRAAAGNMPSAKTFKGLTATAPGGNRTQIWGMLGLAAALLALWIGTRSSAPDQNTSNAASPAVTVLSHEDPDMASSANPEVPPTATPADGAKGSAAAAPSATASAASTAEPSASATGKSATGKSASSASPKTSPRPLRAPRRTAPPKEPPKPRNPLGI